MAIITDAMAKIRQAIYGKDVRENIASGIEAINEEVENTTSRQTNLEATFSDLIINAGNSNAEIVVARGEKASLDERLDSMDQATQNNYNNLLSKNNVLETQAKDILNTDKISRQVELTSGDMTGSIAPVLSDLNSRGVKYAYFDKNIEVNLASALNHNDVLLIGNSKIGNVSADNVYYNISDSFESYVGKINSNFCKFTRLKAAIASGNPINVSIWGDSLSTNGDLIGANTNTASGAERGPDNAQEGDSYTSFLYDMIADAMPDKTVNFRNLAIAGEKLYSWNTTKYLNNANKTWIEHIKDTAPDILVIAFGANHYTRDSQRDFAYNIKQITDYINANFTIKPDLIFVSTPRPTYRPETSWGNYLGQSTRQGVANITRNLAPSYKAYLMDVNRISNIKRAGTDWLNPTFREINDLSPYITNSKDTNGNYALNSASTVLIVNKYMKDFVIKFSVTFSNAGADADCLTVKVNNTYGTFDNNQIVINPKLSTNSNLGHIKAITRIADYANWGTAPTTAKALTEEITTIDLRIEKRNNVLEVHQEGSDVALWKLLLRDKCNVWDTTGVVSFHLGYVSSGFNAIITNLRVFEPIYANHLPTLTDTECYGEFIDGDYTQRASTGGNGVNHPSSRGIIEMYLPCVKELAEDIAEVYRNS